MSKLKTIKEHICDPIKNVDSIGIQKMSIDGDVDRWYLRQDQTLNEILYCPYCGENLAKVPIYMDCKVEKT